MPSSSEITIIIRVTTVYLTLENMAITNALQFKAAKTTPVPFLFYLRCHAKYVTEPIHCRIIVFLQLILYFML